MPLSRFGKLKQECGRNLVGLPSIPGCDCLMITFHMEVTESAKRLQNLINVWLNRNAFHIAQKKSHPEVA